MALDVWLGPKHASSSGTLVGRFDETTEDAFEWLEPIFADLAKATGRRIDRYELASFSGDDLLALKQAFADAASRARAEALNPEQARPGRTLSFGSERMTAAQLVAFIERLVDATDRAIAEGLELGFWGD